MDRPRSGNWKYPQKFLVLHLQKEWFDVMVTGEKKVEYRDCTEYWAKRLFNSDGSVKEFSYIEFRNGTYLEDLDSDHMFHFVIDYSIFYVLTMEGQWFRFQMSIEDIMFFLILCIPFFFVNFPNWERLPS